MVSFGSAANNWRKGASCVYNPSFPISPTFRLDGYSRFHPRQDLAVLFSCLRDTTLPRNHPTAHMPGCATWRSLDKATVLMPSSVALGCPSSPSKDSGKRSILSQSLINDRSTPFRCRYRERDSSMEFRESAQNALPRIRYAGRRESDCSAGHCTI